MNKRVFIAMCSTALAGLAAPGGVAYGQAAAGDAPGASPTSKAPDNNGGITEIIVTAQRRAESVQRASVIVDVIGSKSIARNGVTQVTDLSKILPGVQIGVAGPSLQVYVRGIGDFGATANSNPSVAINIDGVYVARGQEVPSEFYDVDRVEILKGPQGTLYGRNASGGALNILTKQPTLGVYTGDVSAEFANFKSSTVNAAINFPIGSTVAVRVSGTVVNKGGYTSVGFGDDRHQSGRVKVLWKPNADVTLVLNGSGGHVGGQQTASVLVNKVPGFSAQTPWTDISDPRVQPFLISSAGTLAFATDPLSPKEAFQDMNFYNVSAQLDANLGFATLTVLPAFRHASLLYTSVNAVPFADGGAFGNYPQSPETSDQTSVEVRLAHTNAAFKWVVGGYFFNEDQSDQFVSRVGLISSHGERYSLGTRSYAGFGQATYSILHWLRLVGGLRYTSDARTIDGSVSLDAPTFGCGFPFPPLAPGTACPLEAYDGQKTFTNVSWKGGLEVDLAPRSLLFLTVSSGFKSGGFNRSISDTPGAPVANDAQLYQPEKLTAYEVGVKNRFFNNHLQLNVEGFYWDYLDAQESTVLISGAGIPALTVVNAGAAHIFGGSFDMIARPWQNGTFTAAAEYDNSEFTNFSIPALFNFPGSTGCKVLPTVPIPTRDCSGFELPRDPKFSVSSGYTHVFPLASGASIEANSTMQFASARWLSADFVPTDRAAPYVTWNAAVSYYTADQRLSFTGFVRNITNAAAYQGGVEAPFEPGILVASIAPPRNYGVQMAYHF